MTSIAVRGLTKRFGDVLAVDDLSFDVAEGTIAGFLGPNGAGKTTTLRMLLGLVTPTSGTATIAGRAYCELDSPFHHVGAVLEATSFHPGRRAGDHLRVLAVAAGLPDRRVHEVLDQVGLGDVAHRRVKGFSLGMRQRLGLAAALLGDPKVLILDEPANGLDPEGVHWLRQFLRSYADRGGTVLVSSHLLAEVAQTVHEVVIIAAGRLVRHSSLRELADEATPGVWVRTPQAEALRDALVARGITAEMTSPDTVVALDTTTEHVGRAAAGVGVVVYEMTAQHFDLEQYFLALTDPEGAVR
jgi:ABC-2 type transport system ATP-binding protein